MQNRANVSVDAKTERKTFKRLRQRTLLNVPLIHLKIKKKIDDAYLKWIIDDLQLTPDKHNAHWFIVDRTIQSGDGYTVVSINYDPTSSEGAKMSSYYLM